MELKRHPLLFSGMIVILFVLVAFASAQDATPIPIIPNTTEESAAPEIAPPDIPSTNNTGQAEQTAEPEATQSVVPNSEIPTNVINSTCPVGVQEAFTATEQICTDLASGEACVGNGTVSTTFGAEVTGLNFDSPNDRVRLASIDQLTLSSTSAWTVVRGRLELKTKGGNAVDADMLLFGDVTLSDAGRAASSDAAQATVIAQRGMNVRRTPANDGVVVWQLQGGEEVTVTGITADRIWIRIVIPNEFSGTGWVYAPYLEVEGGIEALRVVNENSPVPNVTAPEFGPMQSLELLSAATPNECGEGLPDSGMMLQSPSGTSSDLRFQLNGVIIEFNGTIFIRAQAERALIIYVLEGQAALVDSAGRLAGVVNEQLSAPMDANLQPNGAFTADNYNAANLAGLPTRLLTRPIAFGIEPIGEVADTTVNTGFVTQTPEGFGTAAPTSAPAACLLTAPNDVRNIRSGPSTLYEIVRVLQPNETVSAVGQAVGELNITWFQTDTGGWIGINSVNPSEGCASLPTVQTPPPPPATATPSGPSLSSPVMPAFTCAAGATANTASATSNGSDTSIAIGGTFSVSAGTTVTIATQGGQLRPEFGDFIRIVGEDGTLIAGSSTNPSLRVTFSESRTFNVRFSAGNGDLVVIAVSCE